MPRYRSKTTTKHGDIFIILDIAAFNKIGWVCLSEKEPAAYRCLPVIPNHQLAHLRKLIIVQGLSAEIDHLIYERIASFQTERDRIFKITHWFQPNNKQHIPKQLYHLPVSPQPPNFQLANITQNVDIKPIAVLPCIAILLPPKYSDTHFGILTIRAHLDNTLYWLRLYVFAVREQLQPQKAYLALEYKCCYLVPLQTLHRILAELINCIFDDIYRQRITDCDLNTFLSQLNIHKKPQTTLVQQIQFIPNPAANLHEIQVSPHTSKDRLLKALTTKAQIIHLRYHLLITAKADMHLHAEILKRMQRFLLTICYLPEWKDAIEEIFSATTSLPWYEDVQTTLSAALLTWQYLKYRLLDLWVNKYGSTNSNPFQTVAVQNRKGSTVPSRYHKFLSKIFCTTGGRPSHCEYTDRALLVLVPNTAQIWTVSQYSPNIRRIEQAFCHLLGTHEIPTPPTNGASASRKVSHWLRQNPSTLPKDIQLTGQLYSRKMTNSSGLPVTMIFHATTDPTIFGLEEVDIDNQAYYAYRSIPPINTKTLLLIKSIICLSPICKNAPACLTAVASTSEASPKQRLVDVYIHPLQYSTLDLAADPHLKVYIHPATDYHTPIKAENIFIQPKTHSDVAPQSSRLIFGREVEIYWLLPIVEDHNNLPDQIASISFKYKEIYCSYTLVTETCKTFDVTKYHHCIEVVEDPHSYQHIEEADQALTLLLNALSNISLKASRMYLDLDDLLEQLSKQLASHPDITPVDISSLVKEENDDEDYVYIWFNPIANRQQYSHLLSTDDFLTFTQYSFSFSTSLKTYFPVNKPFLEAFTKHVINDDVYAAPKLKPEFISLINSMLSLAWPQLKSDLQHKCMLFWYGLHWKIVDLLATFCKDNSYNTDDRARVTNTSHNKDNVTINSFAPVHFRIPPKKFNGKDKSDLVRQLVHIGFECPLKTYPQRGFVSEKHLIAEIRIPFGGGITLDRSMNDVLTMIKQSLAALSAAAEASVKDTECLLGRELHQLRPRLSASSITFCHAQGGAGDDAAASKHCGSRLRTPSPR